VVGHGQGADAAALADGNDRLIREQAIVRVVRVGMKLNFHGASPVYLKGMVRTKWHSA
jgi:hypothetical protein